MSVKIFATSRRRPYPPYEQWVIEIRVEGRTFTSECQSRQEATEAAGRIQAEFERYYEEERRALRAFGW